MILDLPKCIGGPIPKRETHDDPRLISILIVETRLSMFVERSEDDVAV